MPRASPFSLRRRSPAKGLSFIVTFCAGVQPDLIETPAPPTISAEATVEEACETFLRSGCACVPLADESGKIVGLFDVSHQSLLEVRPSHPQRDARLRLCFSSLRSRSARRLDLLPRIDLHSTTSASLSTLLTHRDPLSILPLLARLHWQPQRSTASNTIPFALERDFYRGHTLLAGPIYRRRDLGTARWECCRRFGITVAGYERRSARERN